MKRIHIKSFGFAIGFTAALLYLGCAVVMKLAGPELTKIFFNSLLHGIDVSSVLRMDISLTETILVALQVFMIAWLIGACCAALYNIAAHLRREIY